MSGGNDQLAIIDSQILGAVRVRLQLIVVGVGIEKFGVPFRTIQSGIVELILPDQESLVQHLTGSCGCPGGVVDIHRAAGFPTGQGVANAHHAVARVGRNRGIELDGVPSIGLSGVVDLDVAHRFRQCGSTAAVIPEEQNRCVAFSGRIVFMSVGLKREDMLVSWGQLTERQVGFADSRHIALIEPPDLETVFAFDSGKSGGRLIDSITGCRPVLIDIAAGGSIPAFAEFETGVAQKILRISGVGITRVIVWFVWVI